ncbi:MAG: site-2 protease family protein [Coriobacteriales bacterium]|nr:site-2 protease family protein [Coriobacteriales bacterium]
MTALSTIFWGIVILGLIVFIHEGGHYLTARAFKVRVTEFMLGLPGPSIGFKPKRSETRFGVTVVPLGGYARIAGMDETCDETNLPTTVEILYAQGRIGYETADMLSENLGYDFGASLETLYDWGCAKRVKKSRGVFEYVAPECDGFDLAEPRELADPVGFIAAERKKTYISLPWWKRMIILFGGAGANLLFAIIVITGILMFAGTSNPSLTISDASQGMPAYEAGIRAGDTLLAVDGVSVDEWMEFSEIVSSHKVGDVVEIAYERNGERFTATIELAESADGRPVIGVISGTEIVKHGLFDALGTSFSYIGLVTEAILKLINPMTTAEIISESSSIIGISVAAREAASAGWISFIYLTAAISISIGLMNLLPLMPLDGGRMIVETVQRITRKKASTRVLNWYSMIGIALVLVLFVFAMKQDITSLITGVWPW